MSNTFVKDPRDVAKPGDVVKVKVLEVDVQRKRVSLTMRMDDEVPAPGEKHERTPNRANQQRQVARAQPTPAAPEASGALADALRRAGLGK
jgi:uncharacterized protein